MARDKLSPRELKFVRFLLDGKGKRDAAIAAGYKPTGAHVSASELLNRERVLNALRNGVDARMRAGVAVGSRVLLDLAENSKSDDVRLRASQALLDRGGMPLIRQSEITHRVEDNRTDAELKAAIIQMSRELNLPVPKAIDATFEEIKPLALPAPDPEPAPVIKPPRTDDKFFPMKKPWSRGSAGVGSRSKPKPEPAAIDIVAPEPVTHASVFDED